MRSTYRTLGQVGRVVGLWVVSVFAWFVAAGYYLFRPRRVAHSLRFYRALSPDRSLLGRLWWTWKQYQAFARNFSERLLLHTRPDAIQWTTEGFEHIEAAYGEGRGVILVMSHVGNWEIAARILAQHKYPLLLFMGARRGEKVEQEQKTDLARDGACVVVIPQGEDDLIAGIDGLTALREGHLVSVAGDRSWSPSHARAEVIMFGRYASVPLAAHVFAMLSGAPIISFFALRTGRRRYHFLATPGRRVEASSRRERNRVLKNSAQRYIGDLEVVLRLYPTQWYHFERFLGEEAADIDTTNETVVPSSDQSTGVNA